MNIIIVGAGKLGFRLADMFSIKDNNVTIVDNDDEALIRTSSHVDLMTVKANGLDIEVMEQLNLNRTDLLIAVTEFDETNMLIASLAKKMGCRRVAARIRNPEYSNQLDFLKHNLDIDYVTNPDLETAKEIAKMLLKTEAIYMDDFANGKVAMSEFRIASDYYLNAKSLKNVNLPKRVLIVAIKRDNEMIIPNGDTILYTDDILYMIGVREEIKNFTKMYHEHITHPEHKKLRRVMLLGGGKTSFYLAKRLIQSGVQVKIIERNKERCKDLALQLHDALVIHGDATDVAILAEENITDMDAVVMLTGFDEENILLSMVAKKYKVPKIITKVSKSNYISVFHELGIDHALNPILLTASHIMRYAQGGKIKSLSMLLGDYAEVMEVIAMEGSKIVGKPLKDISLPKGIIIGAVVKGGKVLIPDGNMVIEPHNRIIVFCLREDIDKIESTFYKGKRGIFNELWNGI